MKAIALQSFSGNWVEGYRVDSATRVKIAFTLGKIRIMQPLKLDH